MIAETNDYVGEALIGLEVCQELGLPAMVTFASVQPTRTYDGYDYVEACRILADARARRSSASTARAGRRRCCRCSSAIRAAVDIAVAAQPVPYRTSPATPAFEALEPTTAGACSRSSSSRSSARGSRWPTSRAGPATSASTTSASAAAAGRTTCARWPRRWAGETPASRYSPAIELHPVLGGRSDADHEVMGGWRAGDDGVSRPSRRFAPRRGSQPTPAAESCPAAIERMNRPACSTASRASGRNDQKSWKECVSTG